MRHASDAGTRHAGDARAGRRAPLRTGTALLLVALQLSGCYGYVPVGSGAVTPGSRIAVSLTDRGRVALAEPVGPGVRRIEGDFVTASDSTVVLAVSTVEYMDLHVPARWSGERLEISRDHVADLRERRLSRSRTWLAAGLVALGTAALAFVAISGIGGGGIGDRPDDGGGGSQQ